MAQINRTWIPCGEPSLKNSDSDFLTLVITGVWWVFQSNSKTDPSKNENFYEHEKCWTIFDRFCLKVGLTCSQNTRLFWGEIIVFFCKFERKKYTFLSKLFWPFANFRPSSKNKGIPDLLESVFFGLKYLPHICRSKQASAVDLWERHEEKFLSIGKWGQSKRWVASHFATFSHFKRTSWGPIHLDIHLHLVKWFLFDFLSL